VDDEGHQTLLLELEPHHVVALPLEQIVVLSQSVRIASELERR